MERAHPDETVWSNLVCVADDTPLPGAAQVNGMLLEGKKVYVGPFVQRGERPGGEPAFARLK